MSRGSVARTDLVRQVVVGHGCDFAADVDAAAAADVGVGFDVDVGDGVAGDRAVADGVVADDDADGVAGE